MFTLSDVTLLFPAPLSSNKILVYGLVRQLGLSLVLGFFILFQYSWMHGVYGVEPVHLALIIVGYGLTLFFAQLASMASYVRTSGMERAGKTVRYCVFGAAALYGVWAVLSCREELLALAGGDSYQPLLEKGAAFFATLPGLLFPVSGWAAGLIGASSPLTGSRLCCAGACWRRCSPCCWGLSSPARTTTTRMCSPPRRRPSPPSPPRRRGSSTRWCPKT